MAREHAAPGGEPKVPVMRDLAAQVAPRKVLARGRRLGRLQTHELEMIELGGRLAYIFQARFLARGCGRLSAHLDDIDMRALSKPMDRLGEREVLSLHDEREHIPALTATEAVPQLQSRVDLARRRFLVMKGTAAPEVAAALLHGNALAEHGDNVARVANLLDVLVGYAPAGHRAPAYSSSFREAGSVAAAGASLLRFSRRFACSLTCSGTSHSLSCRSSRSAAAAVR